MPSGEEIQRALTAFVTRWRGYSGSEKSEAEQIGLTKLYNAVDEGPWTDLKALHRELDEAVVDCYGWPRSVAQDDRELVARLTSLNKEISEGRRPYAPFG